MEERLMMHARLMMEEHARVMMKHNRRLTMEKAKKEDAKHDGDWEMLPKYWMNANRTKGYYAKIAVENARFDDPA